MSLCHAVDCIECISHSLHLIAAAASLCDVVHENLMMIHLCAVLLDNLPLQSSQKFNINRFLVLNLMTASIRLENRLCYLEWALCKLPLISTRETSPQWRNQNNCMERGSTEENLARIIRKTRLFSASKSVNNCAYNVACLKYFVI